MLIFKNYSSAQNFICQSRRSRLILIYLRLFRLFIVLLFKRIVHLIIYFKTISQQTKLHENPFY